MHIYFINVQRQKAGGGAERWKGEGLFQYTHSRQWLKPPPIHGAKHWTSHLGVIFLKHYDSVEAAKLLTETAAPTCDADPLAADAGEYDDTHLTVRDSFPCLRVWDGLKINLCTPNELVGCGKWPFSPGPLQKRERRSWGWLADDQENKYMYYCLYSRCHSRVNNTSASVVIKKAIWKTRIKLTPKNKWWAHNLEWKHCLHTTVIHYATRKIIILRRAWFTKEYVFSV